MQKPHSARCQTIAFIAVGMFLLLPQPAMARSNETKTLEATKSGIRAETKAKLQQLKNSYQEQRNALTKDVKKQIEERKTQETTQNDAQRIKHLQELGSKSIDKRITSLNNLSTRVSGMVKLTDSQKSSLSDMITAEITSLNQLKAKILADTDVETLKADVKSISLHKVYALFMPKVVILSAVDKLGQTGDALTKIADELLTKIDAAAATGKNVDTLRTQLTSMQEKIAHAMGEIQNASVGVLSLSVDTSSKDTTVLSTARTHLKNAANDLRNAGKDAKQIRTGLQTLGNGSGTSLTQTTN